MAGILLAVGDVALANTLKAQLAAVGHAVVHITRPLAALTEARRTAWEVVVLDGSVLGRDAIVVVAGIEDGATPLIGLGFEDLRLSRSLSLPLDLPSLVKVVGELTGAHAEALVLRSERRVAQANGREVRLTSIEFRLLETLLANRPRDVSNADAMSAIWGASEAEDTPAPLRTHVRNLRLKLAQLGLQDSLRSRRGRGYSLAL